MPTINNRIKGVANAPLRQVLRDHRGMRLSRRINAVFWWCSMHTEHPLPAAPMLTVMPTDAQIEDAWHQASHECAVNGVIPRWGDAVCWNDLHDATPCTNTWD